MDRFAAVCEEVAGVSSRLRKIAIVADYLRSLSNEDFRLAVQFLSEGPAAQDASNGSLFETGAKNRLSIGYSILREALQAVCQWDLPTLGICYQQVGDTGETIGLLLRGQTANNPLSLQKADEIYQQLFQARVTARKAQVLVTAFRTYRPLAIKYFVKVITGNLRIGLKEKMVEEAVAASCGVPNESIREANNRLGDLARVAIAARHGELEGIEAQPVSSDGVYACQAAGALGRSAIAIGLDCGRQV